MPMKEMCFILHPPLVTMKKYINSWCTKDMSSIIYQRHKLNAEPSFGGRASFLKEQRRKEETQLLLILPVMVSKSSLIHLNAGL